MFTITSLPQPHDGNITYKITFFDNYLLYEFSDGRKKIHHSPHTHPHAGNNPERMIVTGEPAVEQIMFAIIGWIRFPIGTFDKILENVYNFKGGDLLNLLN